ncbi:AAA family ATPase [Parahaliea sp. F7430]|uniref:AAA family ATPase n=2 Tax=Sediminihaliea albiluteola TaxID=2758564 RepID=A0A7W2YIZ9_9GAMM|nr:AAA family ATPase [Sediminihaliea albiluteola]
MYHQYFGLKEAPFSIAVNPRYLFMSARHRDALAHLLYGVAGSGGFILLTGEVGTGKTTINRCLLEQLPDSTDIAIILNPALNALELLASACDELGIDYDPDNTSLKTLTDKLQRFLLDNHARGRKTVLLIDEAQHLDFEVLEQIRLLTNLETNSEKLLQIILIGQPELAALLQRPELRQLNQRITARYNLEPLNLAETRAYIRHRLQVAGLAPDRELFPDAVVRRIHRRTRGIPRLINVLCDRVLLGAYGRNKARADRAMVEVAAREVMGERPAAKVWPWLLLPLCLLLIAGLLLWFYWPQQPVLSEHSSPAAVAAVSERHNLPVVTLQQGEQEEAVSALAAAGPPALNRSWLLPPRQAGEYLWALHSAITVPAEVCSTQVQEGLLCYRERVQTWDALQAYDRPLVLELVTEERFSAAALLIAVQGQEAVLASSQGLVNVPLTHLAKLWQGEFYLLWRPPEGFAKPLSIGDKSPVVAQVAQMLAELDGQERPLATTGFSATLETRVRLFQQANHLEADGVVGLQTLLKLNEQLGIDPTRAQAKTLLLGRAND